MTSTIIQWAAALRQASDDLEAELRKRLAYGATLERLPTGQVRIVGGGRKWVGAIGNAPAALGNTLEALGETDQRVTAVLRLKLREVPRPSDD